MLDVNRLDSALIQARAVLDAEPRGILPLASRVCVWEAMIDPGDDEASYGYRIRLKLACVNHVRAIWDSVFPEDRGLDDMLSLASALVEGGVDSRSAEVDAQRFFKTLVFETDFTEETEPAIMLAQAASNAVISAAYRNPDFDVADEVGDDDDLGPESFETSYLCASAVARAMNWQVDQETQDGISARREFWTWYLDDAVKSSCGLAMGAR